MCVYVMVLSCTLTLRFCASYEWVDSVVRRVTGMLYILGRGANSLSDLNHFQLYVISMRKFITPHLNTLLTLCVFVSRARLCTARHCRRPWVV